MGLGTQAPVTAFHRLQGAGGPGPHPRGPPWQPDAPLLGPWAPPTVERHIYMCSFTACAAHCPACSDVDLIGETSTGVGRIC